MSGEDPQSLNDAPEQLLADGGHFVTMAEDGSGIVIKKLPVTGVAASLAKADTALQSSDVGSAAMADTETFVLADEYAAALAGLNLQLAVMQSQIDALSSIYGTDQIAVYETDVYELGVYA